MLILGILPLLASPMMVLETWAAVGQSVASAMPRGATPASGQGGWVTDADYPAISLRNDEEGVVGYRLTISIVGAVTGCQITQSSGFAALDEATCTLLQKRARFNPATGANGVAVEGTYTARVRWKIPQEVPPPQPGTFRYSMVVETDGSQTECQVLQTSGGAQSGASVGPVLCGKQRMDPAYKDSKGNPVRKRVTITTTQTVSVEDVKP
jgi:TonB family protein